MFSVPHAQINILKLSHGMCPYIKSCLQINDVHVFRGERITHQNYQVYCNHFVHVSSHVEGCVGLGFTFQAHVYYIHI